MTTEVRPQQIDAEKLRAAAETALADYRADPTNWFAQEGISNVWFTWASSRDQVVGDDAALTMLTIRIAQVHSIICSPDWGRRQAIWHRRGG